MMKLSAKQTIPKINEKISKWNPNTLKTFNLSKLSAVRTPFLKSNAIANV